MYIVIFALAGSLVILCTLFNYLTLFISRFRIRQKELALRTVYGASGRSLFMLLSVEFAMTLILSLLLSLFFVHTVFSGFRTLSGITSDLSSAYPELLAYTGVIVLVSLTTFLLVLTIFRRKTLNASIGTSNKKLFRKISIIALLIISRGFSFCTIVVTKQMYYLHNTDLGFAFKRGGEELGIRHGKRSAPAWEKQGSSLAYKHVVCYTTSAYKQGSSLGKARLQPCLLHIVCYTTSAYKKGWSLAFPRLEPTTCL
ncbi:MAG: hypothetical protein LBT50_12005 [Prevotellaceae bacterium]|jgi:hypothetical protein|nr:hypothetical protein [Prevotellaceae bacterium]